MSETRYTFCRICEGTCGLEVADRPLEPQRRVYSSWSAVTWDDVPGDVAGVVERQSQPHAPHHPKVKSSFLAGDGPETIEPLSGMSHLSGILVELRKAPPGAVAGEAHGAKGEGAFERTVAA